MTDFNILAQQGNVDIGAIISFLIFLVFIIISLARGFMEANKGKHRNAPPVADLWGDEEYDEYEEPVVMAEALPDQQGRLESVWPPQREGRGPISVAQEKPTPPILVEPGQSSDYLSHIAGDISKDINTAALDNTDERFEQRAEGLFEHRMSQLENAAYSASDVPREMSIMSTFSANEIALAFCSNERLREAFIVSEILRRPEGTT